MSQYSHLTIDLSNDNSSATKVVHLVGRDRLVLDVGCAHGYMAEAIRAHGCRVVGVERNAEDAALARQHCEMVVERDLDEPGWAEALEGRRFDVVAFSDVLEHVRDPAGVLRQTRELLVPGTGYIVASIPNVAHISVRLELLLGSFRRATLGILDETHLHFFTRDTLEDLLASCGYMVVSWDCTTNELANPVIADYLREADISYTPALHERFGEFDAMAYQFIIAARPVEGVVVPTRVPLKKPLQTMQETWREFQNTSQALQNTIQALQESNRVLEERTRALQERDRVLEEQSHALQERDRVLGEQARALQEKEQMLHEQHGALREQDRLLHERNLTLQERDRTVARLCTTPADIQQPREGGLRILQVVHQFLPHHISGTEVYCADLSFALAHRGHAVRVLAGAHTRDDLGVGIQWQGDDAIVVEKIPAARHYRALGSVRGFFDRFDNPEARFAIGDVLRWMRPDVVHVQHLLSLSAQLFAECASLGIPVVLTLHDYWFLCHKIKLRRRDGSLCDGPARGWNCSQCLNAPAPARSRLNPLAVGATMYRYAYLTRQLLRADRILAPSRFLLEVFARNGVPADRLVYLPLGTAGPAAEVDAHLPASPRRARPRFGFLGSVTYDKGVHVLIDAFNELPIGEAELHLFGSAPDAGYFADLERRSRHPDIHWRGARAPADRWKALAEMDVLVVPSVWYENSPLTILEARAARVPVIASAIGGIPEFVQDGVTGRTFPAGDGSALGACLREVLANPERIAEWRRAIRSPKALDAHVDEIETLYREVRAGRAGDGARAAT